jgi:hypothetical protein
MRILTIVLLALLSVAAALVMAKDAPKPEQSADAPPADAPIFGQRVTFTEPPNFVTLVDQSSLDVYIRKSVPKGETLDQWTAMITLTGAKNAVTDAQKSAQYFAAQIAAGFQKACPATFTVKPLGPTRISDQDAFIAITSCGKVDADPEKHSETALIVAIKSATDVYTLQWAERTPSNAENLTIDESKWQSRLAKLAPIRLCPIKPGEQPPYPSCVDK